MLLQASAVARICARGASTLTRQCPVSRARPCLSRRLQPVRAMASEVEAAQKAAAAQQCAQESQALVDECSAMQSCLSYTMQVLALLLTQAR